MKAGKRVISSITHFIGNEKKRWTCPSAAKHAVFISRNAFLANTGGVKNAALNMGQSQVVKYAL